jgi:hypothetical protein
MASRHVQLGNVENEIELLPVRTASNGTRLASCTNILFTSGWSFLAASIACIVAIVAGVFEGSQYLNAVLLARTITTAIAKAMHAAPHRKLRISLGDRTASRVLINAAPSTRN